MLNMPELVLELLGQGIVLLVAVVTWGLANKWRDRRTRSHRYWTQALLVAICLGATFNVATTWQTHLTQQSSQARLSRIDRGVEQLVALARERNPALSEKDALNEVVEELRALRQATSDLGFELEGVRRYGSVAELNAFGLKGLAGSGLKESSPISRVLENAYIREEREGQVRIFPRCDTTGATAFDDAATLNPDFPFAYWGLAVCGYYRGDPSWRVHAEQAVTIFQHTTQIAGHKPDHDDALKELTALLSQ